MNDAAEATATETTTENTETQETVEQTSAPDTETQTGDGATPPEVEEAQTTEETEAHQQDDGPVFTPELLQRAGKFGYDKYDVEALFDSPEKLERALSRLELHSPRQEQAKQEPVAKQPEKPKFELKFGDDFDPEGRKVIETMHQHYEGVVADFQAKIDTLMGYVNDQQVKETSARLDKMFEALPAEYEAVKTTKSQQWKVVQEMAVMEEAYRSKGMEVPEEKELFRRALAHVADVDPKKAARAEISAQLGKGKNKLMVRPKSKSVADSGLTREEIAIRNAEAKYRELEGK